MVGEDGGPDALEELFQREVSVRNSQTKEVKVVVTGDFYTEAEMTSYLSLEPSLELILTAQLFSPHRSPDPECCLLPVQLRERIKEIKAFAEANPSFKRLALHIIYCIICNLLFYYL